MLIKDGMATWGKGGMLELHPKAAPGTAARGESLGPFPLEFGAVSHSVQLLHQWEIFLSS